MVKAATTFKIWVLETDSLLNSDKYKVESVACRVPRLCMNRLAVPNLEESLQVDACHTGNLLQTLKVISVSVAIPHTGLLSLTEYCDTTMFVTFVQQNLKSSNRRFPMLRVPCGSRNINQASKGCKSWNVHIIICCLCSSVGLYSNVQTKKIQNTHKTNFIPKNHITRSSWESLGTWPSLSNFGHLSYFLGDLIPWDLHIVRPWSLVCSRLCRTQPLMPWSLF